MELTEKLKNTSSSRLADRIKATEGELGKLVSAQDQAESEAVSKAGEDVAYQKAADHAGELGRQVAEKRERLKRLRTAHRAALDRECEELIESLKTKLKGLVAALDKTRKEVDRLRAVEDQRHKKETDRLDRRLAEAELAEAEADIALHEEQITAAQEQISTAESTGDSASMVFYRGHTQMMLNAMGSNRGRRGAALEKIAKLDQP